MCTAMSSKRGQAPDKIEISVRNKCNEYQRDSGSQCKNVNEEKGGKEARENEMVLRKEVRNVINKTREKESVIYRQI